MTETAKELLAQATEDYKQHNNPETQAEARMQLSLACAHGNEASASWNSYNNDGRSGT